MFTGHSFNIGAEIFDAGEAVRQARFSLSPSFPERMPQMSVPLRILEDGTFTENSRSSSISRCEWREGRTDMQIWGGFDAATPHQAIVIAFALLLLLSRQQTMTTGTGYNASHGPSSDFPIGRFTKGVLRSRRAFLLLFLLLRCGHPAPLGAVVLPVPVVPAFLLDRLVASRAVCRLLLLDCRRRRRRRRTLGLRRGCWRRRRRRRTMGLRRGCWLRLRRRRTLCLRRSYRLRAIIFRFNSFLLIFAHSSPSFLVQEPQPLRVDIFEQPALVR